MSRWFLGSRFVAVCAFGSVVFAGNWWLAADNAHPDKGRELFIHEWTAHDPLCREGDGLGPMYNAQSCVACHFQGGVGGGGTVDKNVQLMTPIFSTTQAPNRASSGQLMPGPRGFTGADRHEQLLHQHEFDEARKSDAENLKQVREALEKVAAFHAGFKTSATVVLHRHSTNPEYKQFRTAYQARPESFRANSMATGIQAIDALTKNEPWAPQQENELNVFKTLSKPRDQRTNRPIGTHHLSINERNTPALFGAGLLDKISDEALVKVAEKKDPDFPEITGRVARVKGSNRYGHFGWKAQKGSLDDFVRAACAAELGLNVPGEAQTADPLDSHYQPPGLDLTQDDCNQMVAFIASLPQPIERIPEDFNAQQHVQHGRELFEAIGCANCHTPQLGGVSGVYSDLLLHDMGTQMISNSSHYGGPVETVTPVSPTDFASADTPNFSGMVVDMETMSQTTIEGALASEWRTPPLWGVADSAPYMHDGRAETLEQAIAWHSGEAVRVTKKFFRLEPAERQELLSFLNILRVEHGE